MAYILLYDGRYGYLESIHSGYVHHTQDFRRAAIYKYLDKPMCMGEYLGRCHDSDYHIEVFSVEG